MQHTTKQLHIVMSLKKLYFLLLLLSLLPMSSAAKRYTVMVSLDGFRQEYTRAYNTPFLNKMGNDGVQAIMQPSFPSKTFPNHYTLVTGLVPAHHGIIANTFLDQKTNRTFSLGNNETRQDPYFWHGEPIWNTATRQGVKSGVVYWPGSDVKIGGHFPTYYHNYLQKPLLTFAERVAEVTRYLRLPEAERPQLVLAYFEEPDHSGHTYGPWASETRHAVERMDHIIESLYESLQTLDIRDSINLIVLADHGMTQTDNNHRVNPYEYVKKEWLKRIHCDLPTHVWPKKGCEKKVYEALLKMPHVKVWRKSEMPAYLRYADNENIGEIVVNPDCGWMITDTKVRARGMHGFDNTSFDMQVPFLAIGPDFKTNYTKTQVFSNTAIYGLLCHLLHIQPAQNDGSWDEIKDVVK